MEGVNSMEPLRLGLIGLGGMGKSHLAKEVTLDEVRFVGVADISRAAVEEVKRTYGLPGFDDFHQLIDSGSCEAVLVATPHPFHAPIALYAIERGLHVLSEKPIAVTVHEADRMIEAADRAGVKLGVMFQTRTEPHYRKAHELLEAGAIGAIYRSVMVASHWYRSQAYYDSGDWRGTWRGEGGGVLMNQSPHSLDLFIWLGGQPRRLRASTKNRFHRIEVEDTAEALLDYGDGHTGYLYTTTAEWPGEDRFDFVGESGRLTIQDKAIRLYRLDRSIREHVATNAMWGKPTGDWETISAEPLASGHHAVVRQFARSIRLGEPLVATGVDGLRSLELANAIMLAGDTGESITLPLDRDAYDRFLERKRAAVPTS
jgi:predicted dehydrogenase